MHPKRRCDGILLLAAGFFLCGFFLNEPAALFPATGILILLGIDALILLRKAQNICDNLSITRKTTERYARVGSIQNVTFLVHPGEKNLKTSYPGCQIHIRDLLPRGVIQVSGTTGGEPDTPISYAFQSLVTGAIQPEGAEVTIEDVFFSTTIQMRRNEDREPRFVVLPLPEEWESLRPGFGTRETDKKSVLSDSRSILLLRFMSMVKGIKVTSLDSAAYNIPLTYSIATSLNNVELDHLIYNLEERLGV